MTGSKTNRGFGIVEYKSYPQGGPTRLIQESSAIGEYEDSFDCPGSSFLWVGDNHHLNREEVAELIGFMQAWLDEKRLPAAPDAALAGGALGSPACAMCGAPATCYGSYEGQPAQYGCDMCCGHGNEDGWCEQ